MDQSASALESIFRTWAGLSSHFIGECFDIAKPFLDKDYAGLDPYFRFVSAQLFIDCHLTSESVLLLVREGKEWDADLVTRSVMEGTLKYVYMSLGTMEEMREKALEYWDLLPMFADIKHSELSSKILSALPESTSLERQPFRDLLMEDEEIDAIRKKYSRSDRRALEEKWSFSGLSKLFSEQENVCLSEIAGLAHGYGMSSHLLHKDGVGVGMVWERARRDPQRKTAASLGHAARITSDMCAFAKFRLFHLLKACSANLNCIRDLEIAYAQLFDELNAATEQFSQSEYAVDGT